MTFLKRKNGLFKKAFELAVLCRAEVAVIVFAGNKKLYEFASSDMKDVLYRYTQVPNPRNSADDRRNRMNIVVLRTLQIRKMVTLMTLMTWELMSRQSIITESHHILLNLMALPNFTVIFMIEIPVKIPSDLVIEDHLWHIPHNFYLIELPHFTPDRTLCTRLILLRNSFKFR